MARRRKALPECVCPECILRVRALDRAGIWDRRLPIFAQRRGGQTREVIPCCSRRADSQANHFFLQPKSTPDPHRRE